MGGGGGGRGIFSLHDFFFSLTACAGIFFSGETLCTNFFFRQILLFEKVIDSPTQTPLCGFTVVARKPLKFCSGEFVFERFIFLKS